MFKHLFRRRQKSASYAVLPALSGLGFSAGEAVKSPTLAACLRWITSGITEAPLVAEQMVSGGDGWEEVGGWPQELDFLFSDIVQGGIVQQTPLSRDQGLAIDLAIHGNALAYILRQEGGAPLGLERIPWHSVTAQMSRGRITAWRTSLNGMEMAPEDVIHIRRGSSQREPALGESLIPALREPVAADVEAARYMARVLGSPSPSFSITGEYLGHLNDDEVSQVTQGFVKATSGENAAKVVLNPGDLKIEHLGFSPEQMAIKELAEHPQFAICSIMGVPPQVLDVSASRSASTYNNVSEASRKAARSCLAPLWEMLSAAYSEAVAESGYRVRFRVENVRALQEDEDLKAARASKLYSAGVIDRAEAKRVLGLDPLPEDEGWYSSYDRMPAPLSGSEVSAIRDQVGA